LHITRLKTYAAQDWREKTAMVHNILRWMKNFAKDKKGEIEVEAAALSTGVSVTIFVVLKTLFRAFT